MNLYTFISQQTGINTHLWSKWWIERITPEFKWACFKVTRIVNSHLFLNFWKKISAVSGDAFTFLEVSKINIRGNIIQYKILCYCIPSFKITGYFWEAQLNRQAKVGTKVFNTLVLHAMGAISVKESTFFTTPILFWGWGVLLFWSKVITITFFRDGQMAPLIAHPKFGLTSSEALW